MENKKHYLQALAQSFASVPFNQVLGLELVSFDDKNVRVKFSMKPELIGNFMHGILHGGVISSVLDMAGGMVVMSSLMHQNMSESEADIAALLAKTGAINLNVSYMNPGKGDFFFAEALLMKQGRHISFTEMVLRDAHELCIAKAQGTYKT